MTITERFGVHPFEAVMSSIQGRAGAYRLDVDDLWEGQPGNVFGGFLAALSTRAAALESVMARPVSATTQFLRPAAVGANLALDVASLQRGRTSELLRVTIRQNDKTVTEALIRTAADGEGPACAPRRAPAPEDPEALPSGTATMRAQGVEPPRMMSCWETRFGHDGGGTDDGRDTGFWARLGPDLTFDDPYLEAGRYLLSLDSQANAVIRRLGADRGPEPLPWGFANLDSLVHFHQVTGSDWILSENTVLAGGEGRVGVQSQVWSLDGVLLATAMSQVTYFPLRADWSFAREAN